MIPRLGEEISGAHPPPANFRQAGSSGGGIFLRESGGTEQLQKVGRPELVSARGHSVSRAGTSAKT